jgi:hypothetical protein
MWDALPPILDHAGFAGDVQGYCHEGYEPMPFKIIGFQPKANVQCVPGDTHFFGPNDLCQCQAETSATNNYAM